MQNIQMVCSVIIVVRIGIIVGSVMIRNCCQVLVLFIFVVLYSDLLMVCKIVRNEIKVYGKQCQMVNSIISIKLLFGLLNYSGVCLQRCRRLMLRQLIMLQLLLNMYFQVNISEMDGVMQERIISECVVLCRWNLWLKNIVIVSLSMVLFVIISVVYQIVIYSECQKLGLERICIQLFILINVDLMLGLSGRCKKLILIFDIIGYVIRLFSSNKLGVRSSSVKGILE